MDDRIPTTWTMALAALFLSACGIPGEVHVVDEGSAGLYAESHADMMATNADLRRIYEESRDKAIDQAALARVLSQTDDQGRVPFEDVKAALAEQKAALVEKEAELAKHDANVAKADRKFGQARKLHAVVTEILRASDVNWDDVNEVAKIMVEEVTK